VVSLWRPKSLQFLIVTRSREVHSGGGRILKQAGRSWGSWGTLGVALLLLSPTSFGDDSRYGLGGGQFRTHLEAEKPASIPDLNARLTAGLRGTYFEDQFNRDSLSAVYFKLSAEQELMTDLVGNAQVQAVFEQGTSQGLLNRNTRRATGFFLRDAKLSYEPAEWLKLQAGAIDQRGLNSQMLIASQPFPALRQRLRLHCSSSGCTEFVTQQAIPTSQTLSSRAVEKEPLPGYFSGSLLAEYSLASLSRFAISSGYYHFQKLPSTVAGESCDLGNSVTSCLPNSEFLYGFSGTQNRASLWLALAPRFTWAVEGEYLQNFAAAAGRAQGYKIGTGFVLKSSANSTLKIGAGYIEKQSDVAPSFYSNWMAEGNRRIALGEVIFQHFPSNIKLTLRAADSTPITENGFQQPMTNVMLNMEKSYVTLD
jgi:hypothetical protein